MNAATRKRRKKLRLSNNRGLRLLNSRGMRLLNNRGLDSKHKRRNQVKKHLSTMKADLLHRAAMGFGAVAKYSAFLVKIVILLLVNSAVPAEGSTLNLRCNQVKKHLSTMKADLLHRAATGFGAVAKYLTFLVKIVILLMVHSAVPAEGSIFNFSTWPYPDSNVNLYKQRRASNRPKYPKKLREC